MEGVGVKHNLLAPQHFTSLTVRVCTHDFSLSSQTHPFDTRRRFINTKIGLLYAEREISFNVDNLRAKREEKVAVRFNKS